ncbi:hypothetical protein F4825DRAFT_326421 [Nemania diffusa]|nr:hypothetical protein F4825DRAFT_326421 [Nemania diffusa]
MLQVLILMFLEHAPNLFSAIGGNVIHASSINRVRPDSREKIFPVRCKGRRGPVATCKRQWRNTMTTILQS